MPADGVGAGVTEDDIAGVVAAGEAAEVAPAAGDMAGGVSSCAKAIETAPANKSQKHKKRGVIGHTYIDSNLICDGRNVRIILGI